MKIQNLERFNAKLKKLPKDTKEAMRKAIAESAEEIVNLQKKLVPIDDGDLQMSITWRWGDEKKIAYSQTMGTIQGGHALSAVITAGNTRVRYAHLVEFGVSAHVAGGKFEGAMIPAIPAQPFFYPGWRSGKTRAKRRINRAVNKAAKKTASS